MRAGRYRIMFGVLCVLALVSAGPMVLGQAQTHDDGVHDHDDDHEGRGIIGLLGRLHGPAVHFPIALVVTAALAEVLSALKDGEHFAFAARFMLYVAAVAGVTAAAVGFAAAAGESFSDQLAVNFTFHRILGVATPILIFLSLGLSESARRTGAAWQQTAYQVILLITVLSVVMGGYLGGTL